MSAQVTDCKDLITYASEANIFTINSYFDWLAILQR